MDFRSWCLHYFPGGTFSDGGDQYSCRNHYRDEKNASLSFCDSRRAWNDFGQSEGGKISEFCREHGLPEWDGAPEHREERKPLPAPNDKASEARRLWEQAKDAINHPYLTRKGIDGQGCRVTADGTLLVPAYNVSGDVVGVERIDAAGSKKHLGTKGGAFFPCGDVKNGKTVLIAEGFATAKSIHAITGFPTLAAFGAVNLLGAAQSLRGREVLICPDADDAGRKTAAQCRAAGFKVAELPPESRNGLDWNDVHVEQGIEPAKALFKDRWAVAQVERVEAPREEDEVNILDLVESPSPGTAQKPEKVWHFPRKHLNIMAADPGMGKSILITKVAADLSMGFPVLGMIAEPVRKTLYLNGECGKDYFDWRFKASGWGFSKENFRVTHQEIAAEKGVDLDLDSPQGRKNLEKILEANRPDLFVIDSLPAFSDEDMNDGQAQNALCKYLKQLAIKYNLALVLITHLRKRKLQDQSAEPTLSEIQGSNAGAKLCNVALVVYEAKIEEDGEERVIKICKSVKAWGPKVLPFGFSFPELGEDELTMTMEEIPERQKALQGSWERVRTALQYTEFSREAVESVLGISEKTAKKLLFEWKQQGKIERIGRGKNTVYLVRKGQSGYTLPIVTPNEENPVIASNESGKAIYPESAPQEGNHSGYIHFPESNPVISMDYDDSGKYRDGATPNQEDSQNHSGKQGNLEPFFPGGFKTGLSSPRGGPSIEDLASRAGVSQAAVQEELDRWKKCGRLKEDGEKIIILEGSRYPGDDQEPPENEDEPPVSAPKGPPKTLRLPAPSEKKYVSMKDVSLSDAEAWAAGVPGLVAQLKAQAVKEHDPVMERSARDLYESLVRIEYADHLQRGLDGEAPGQGGVPHKGSASPGEEAGGQASLLFPPEEPPAPATPPGRNPLLEIAEEDDEEPSTPRGEDRSGPPPGWLEFQSEEVRSWHAETLKRLNIIGVPNHEEAALYRTWEQFGGKK